MAPGHHFLTVGKKTGGLIVGPSAIPPRTVRISSPVRESQTMTVSGPLRGADHLFSIGQHCQMFHIRLVVLECKGRLSGGGFPQQKLRPATC